MNGDLQALRASLSNSAAPADKAIVGNGSSELVKATDELFFLSAKTQSNLLLLKALSTAAKARVISPDSVATLHNLAVALEVAGAKQQALNFWRRLLTKETNPDWLGEISQNIAQLSLTSNSSSWNRGTETTAHGEEVYSPDSQLVISKLDTQGLHAIRDSIADLDGLPKWISNSSDWLSSTWNDPLYLDIIRRNGSLTREQRRTVASGANALIEGRELLASSKAAQALPRLELSRRLLLGTESPLIFLCRYSIALANFHSGHRKKSLEEALSLVDDALNRGYLSVAGQAGRLASVLQQDAGYPEESLETLRQAERCFRMTGQRGHLASTLSHIAAAYKGMGEFETEWRFRFEALRLAREFGDITRLPVLFGVAALSAAERGEYEAALALHSETFDLELKSGDPLNISEAIWWRGVIHQKGKRPDLALGDADAALEYSQKISNETQRRNALAGIYKLRGELLIDTEPLAALEAFQEALDLGDSLELEYIAGELHFLRSRAARSAGDIFLAEQELLVALGEFEEKRGRIKDRNKRTSYFEKARPVFEELVVLNQSALGRPDEALGYADFGRARELQAALDRDFRTPGSVNPDPGDIPRWLKKRPNAAPPIVMYEVLEKTTLAWVVADQIQAYNLGIGREALGKLIDTAVGELDRARKTPNSGAALEAYRILIAPWLSRTAPASRIVIVPDEDLFRLPFQALVDPVSGQFLIERTEIVLSPSLGWADGRPDPRRVKAPSVLAAEAADGLTDSRVLSKAREEIEELSQLYTSFDRLDSATAEQFAREAGSYDLVHFAGHATAGDRRSEPHLIFGPEDHLPVSEIRDLDLRRNRLVVLAACETNAAKNVGLDGPATLATAFLSAGAHGVLATLRNVGDRESFLLMKRFHTHLAQGNEPPTAFRNAVIEMIHEENRGPAAWAPFELIGSFAPPRTPAASLN